ncbi:HD domain-containing protein [bacterium]|nr:MAG: HD domain-containing protein [bacterium]
MHEGRKIFIVDSDEPEGRYIRERLILDGNYSVALEFSGQAGLVTFRENSFDIVLVRSGLSDVDCQDFLRELKKVDQNCVAIILLEAENLKLIQDLSRLGVYAFVDEPVNIEKLLFLIRKGLELRSLTVTNHKMVQSLNEQNASLQKQNTLLAKRIEESTRNLTRLYEDLRSTYMRTIKVLAQAIDARDHYTHSHSENVARYAVAICEELKLPAKEIEMIREACELHDLGKIGVEDSILLKPSSLTEEEWAQIKLHPMTAARILEPLTFLNGVTDLVKQHHEHYDGSGYPDKRKGDDILLGARIIHLADAYDSMISARAYRKVPLSKEDAIMEIRKNTGTQFDPKVVNAFLRIADSL